MTHVVPDLQESSRHAPALLLARAATIAGSFYILEAVLSVYVDSHVGYHAPNLLLNAGLLVAAVCLGRRPMPTRTGRVGAVLTSIGAGLAAAGGLVAVVLEGTGLGQSPGSVEGIAHTAILLALLGSVVLGAGLRGSLRVSGAAIAVTAAVLLGMVLAGLDDPGLFLAPEALHGIVWLWLARRSLASLEGT